MFHYFNVCDINGADVAPVDVITFGSPCQDLSIAGKRAGLDGKRSGLFMEAVRIIKEMRDADKLRNQWLPDTKNRNGSNADSESGTARERGNDSIRTANASSTDNTKGGTTNIEKPITQYGFCGTDNIRPRFAVWENVPGAFSSGKGEDFRIVLEELAKIKDPTVSIPRPKDGKWLNAGQIVGNGWSIAWRVLDAQFWGVPQRRRRIFLVADFAGGCAGEILFEQSCGDRDIKKSK
jgi:DNA (cytosine-5)-methyltransferase 1